MIEVYIWAGTTSEKVRHHYTFRSKAAADRFLAAAFNQGIDGKMVWYSTMIEPPKP